MEVQNSMTAKIRFWQWPNVLAIDAGMIAAAWLWVFARQQQASLGTTPYLVLALSVWLTYLADRLFDAGPREKIQLRSARHQFAKRRSVILWLIWIALFPLNLALALTSLNPSQLMRGFVMLFFCLAYTILNHLLSGRFFPKELFVAVLFAGGIQVSLPDHCAWGCLAGFTILCLVNCLMIGWKEKTVDALLEVRSLSSVLDLRWGHGLLVLAVGISLFSDCTFALLPPALLLGTIQLKRECLGREPFRVLCDSALLIGPLLYFFCSGVLVR